VRFRIGAARYAYTERDNDVPGIGRHKQPKFTKFSLTKKCRKQMPQRWQGQFGGQSCQII
jgi:hypothetical protein